MIMQRLHGNVGKVRSAEFRKEISLRFRGKKLSEEHGKKIGEANRRRVLSEETKRKIGLANKGKTLGRKLPLETIIKMKAKRKLQVFSNETKLKISASAKKRIGKLNSNWRGGITEEGLRIRTCSKNLKWREDVFIRDNFTCKKCGDNRGGNLAAHHIKPFKILLEEAKNNLPTLDLFSAALIYSPLWNISNGITLCESCHENVGGGS